MNSSKGTSNFDSSKIENSNLIATITTKKVKKLDMSITCFMERYTLHLKLIKNMVREV